MTTDPRISPFTVDIPESALDDLRARVANTRWPDELPGAGWEYGIPLDTVRRLAEYWTGGYDWRAHERTINRWPQLVTEIDGQRIHALHVRSDDPDALPLLLLHGWPSSVVEYLEVIEPLRERYHLVIPSLPGFGFSGPTRERGWDVPRIVGALQELMQRLGYARYGVHGSDWGSLTARELARVDAAHVVGAHVTYLQGPSPDDEPEWTDDERARLDRQAAFVREENGYMAQQSTRPQTLAYALTDSPVGQLAWIAEKFRAWTDPEVWDIEQRRDAILTEVSVYWFTATAGSSARLYWENRWRVADTPSTTPTGVAVFGRDPLPPVRRLAEIGNNVAHWAEYERGGHFPALEVPELFVRELRTFFG